MDHVARYACHGRLGTPPNLLPFILQVLHQASKLEVLQVFFKQPTIQDMDLLTSFPALRKLIIHHEWQASDSLIDATLSLCRRSMPHVEVFDDSYVSCEEDFFRQACCL